MGDDQPRSEPVTHDVVTDEEMRAVLMTTYRFVNQQVAKDARIAELKAEAARYQTPARPTPQQCRDWCSVVSFTDDTNHTSSCAYDGETELVLIHGAKRGDHPGNPKYCRPEHRIERLGKVSRAEAKMRALEARAWLGVAFVGRAAPMPSPSPTTMEGLHRILSWLRAEGYEPVELVRPEAQLFVAGRSWHVDNQWFIEVTAPSGKGDVAVDVRPLRVELEKQARYPVKDEKPPEPEEPTIVVYLRRIASNQDGSPNSAICYSVTFGIVNDLLAFIDSLRSDAEGLATMRRSARWRPNGRSSG